MAHMTPKQTALYWRSFGQARKARPDADRVEITRQALGYHKSSKELSDREFDLVLQAFWAIANPDQIDPQVRQINGDRRRLLWRIAESARCLQLYVENTDAYIGKILSAKFGIHPGDPRDIEDLKNPELLQLQSTLWARANALRKKAGHTVSEMRQRANASTGQQSEPDICFDALPDHARQEAECPF